MHDAFLVRGIESIRELDAEFDRAIDRNGPGGEHLIQRTAVEQLHADKRALVELFDGMNSADGGMRERGSSACFAQKPFEGLRVAAAVLGKEFESYPAAKSGVLRLIDDTHAARAKLAENPVVGDRFVDHARNRGC